LDYREQFKDTIIFSKDDFSLSRFEEVLRSQFLFSSPPPICLEGLPDLRVFKGLPNLLSQYCSVRDICVWVDKGLAFTHVLVKLAKEKGRLFSYEQKQSELVFVWLEAVFSKQSPKAFRLLSQVLEEGGSGIYLIALMVSQTRSLLALSQGCKYMEEKHPFYLKKLRPQLKNYNREFLCDALAVLAEADYKVKTGQLLAENAVWSLSFMFLEV